MYSYEITPEAREQVDGLPADALAFYAELIAFLELTPAEGLPYRDDKPDGAMRQMIFGRIGEGIAVYLILERERRVVVLAVTWIG